jgi:hypothetical protein
MAWAVLLVSTSAFATCTSSGTTLTAASCGSTDVAACFSAATSSTTQINIPAGTCGWATQVSFTLPSGSTPLTIAGATTISCTGTAGTSGYSCTPTDNTIIEDNYASSNAILSIVPTANSAEVRITGITFEGGTAGTGNDKFDGMVVIGGASTSVRVDHSHFNVSTYSPALNSSAIQFEGCTYGVLDHSVFDSGSGTVNNQVRDYNSGACFSDALGLGDQSWAHSTSLGTSSFMYAEGNVFNNGFANDCTNGGRFVFRYNNFNVASGNEILQTHPTGGGGRIRGCRAWEIYNNYFNATPGSYLNAGVWISSGTGVLWGNTFPSSSSGGGTGFKYAIELLSMRRDNSTYPEGVPPAGWGYCGTSSGLAGDGSNWDGSQGSTGYPCLDQPGRGIGDLLTGGFTADGSGSNNVTNNATGCIYSATCAYPREALEPIYEWLDSYSPVPSNPSAVFGFGTGTFTSNTDYYAWCNASSQTGCTTYNGTAGVGSGLFASKPATCTQGVGYWATDQSTLYICGASNNFVSSYTPYTYPHPLDTNSTATSGAIGFGTKLSNGVLIQ